jgi:WXXGXW repeat (2 copies)
MQACNHSSRLTLEDRKIFSHFALRIATVSMGSVLLAVAMLVTPKATYAGASVGVFVSIGPPPLPVYTQPLCPAPGYIWTPGYWAWDPADGYYWVPGSWVLAPVVGYLWTPGYWGWSNGGFIWNVGYWGPTVGFYGGINYGFGYVGVGYAGGYWNNGAFYYNRVVNNVSTTNVTNVYNRTVVVSNTTVNNVSYNGGPGGIQVQPTAAQLAAGHERHVALTATQRQQQEAAHANPAQFVSRNAGKPAVAATPKPGVFSGPGVVQAARAGGTINSETYRLTAKSTTSNPPAGRTPNPAGGGTHPLITAHPNSTTPSETPTPHAETTPHSATQPRSTPPPRTETRPRPTPQTQTETPHSAPAPHKTTPPPETKREEEHKITQARPTPPSRPEAKSRPAPQTQTETRSAPAPHKTAPPPEINREREHTTIQARSTPPPRPETRPRPAPKAQTETRSAPAPHNTTRPPETKREEQHKPEPPK